MRSEIILIMLFAIVLLVKNRARVIASLTGTDPKTAPVKKAPVTAPAKNKEVKKEPEEKPNWFLENLWSILLVLAGIMALVFLSLQVPELTPSQTGNWSQKYWLQILIIWFIGAALVWLNVKEKGSSETLQKVLVGAVIVLLFILPFWSWISNLSSTPPRESRSEIPLARMLPRDAPDLPRAWKPDGNLTDTLKWPRVKVPHGGDSVHVPGILNGHVVWVWNGNVRGLSIRCVHEDRSIGIVGDTSSPCRKDGVVESYMHNDGTDDAEASYAYASRDEK